MTAILCPYGARIKFNLDAIAALWEGRALLGKTLSAVNCLTTDEKRDILGFKPEPRLPLFIPVSGATAAAGDATNDGGGTDTGASNGAPDIRLVK